MYTILNPCYHPLLPMSSLAVKYLLHNNRILSNACLSNDYHLIELSYPKEQCSTSCAQFIATYI